MRFLILLFLAFAAAHAEEFNYEGYTVFRMYANTEEQKIFLKQIEAEGFDFWTDVNNVGAPVDVMVSPKEQFRFLSYSRMAGINPTVMIENVQRYTNRKFFDFPELINFYYVYM
jgi:hypothetical protein